MKGIPIRLALKARRRARQRRKLLRLAHQRGLAHALPPAWQPDGTIRRHQRRHV